MCRFLADTGLGSARLPLCMHLLSHGIKPLSIQERYSVWMHIECAQLRIRLLTQEDPEDVVVN